MTIMGLSYVVEEIGMSFPFPFTLEMNNDAARIFCLGSAHKTKLKHIDFGLPTGMGKGTP